ncbi:MAG: HIT domain-containing protein [Vulcanimicrobiaceae bacterium]
MTDCIFCKIARKEIAATEVMRTERVVAFRDLNPQSPAHVLVIPTRHVDNLTEFLAAAPDEEIAELMRAVGKIGGEIGAAGGYRVVSNQGRDGGQTVYHLHWHILAGRRMTWPPG